MCVCVCVYVTSVYGVVCEKHGSTCAYLYTQESVRALECKRACVCIYISADVCGEMLCTYRDDVCVLCGHVANAGGGGRVSTDRRRA